MSTANAEKQVQINFLGVSEIYTYYNQLYEIPRCLPEYRVHLCQ